MLVGYTDIKAYQAKITKVPAIIAALLHNSSVIIQLSCPILVYPVPFVPIPPQQIGIVPFRRAYILPGIVPVPAEQFLAAFLCCFQRPMFMPTGFVWCGCAIHPRAISDCYHIIVMLSHFPPSCLSCLALHVRLSLPRPVRIYNHRATLNPHSQPNCVMPHTYQARRR